MNIRNLLLGSMAIAIMFTLTSCGVPATFIASKPGTGFSPGYVNGIVYATWPQNAASSISQFRIVLRLQTAPPPAVGDDASGWTTQNVVEYTEILDSYRVNAACIPGLFWRIQYRATSWSNGNKATTGAQNGPARHIRRCP